MELSPDSVLRDRYRVMDQLGHGGMGTVYLAYDNSLDTEVAIKSNINPGEHSERQFLREAQLLAALRHPNLPRVTDYFVLDEVQYLVMDYIPGNDLSERLKAEGVQSVEQSLEWGYSLAKALTYLHSQKPPVIHRDIKPSNIKITPKGHLVLVDFGIAKAEESGVTTTGARGFTPGFAPPEQYGSGATGPYSDQYAFGATLYALMTGEPPIESVERMMGQEGLKPPRSLNELIPEHVDKALQRALSIYPEQRYSGVADFSTALKNPDFVAPEPTIMASSLGAQTPTPVPGTADAATGEQPAAAPAKRSPLPMIIGAVVVLAVVLVGVFALTSGGGDNGEVDSGQATLAAAATQLEGTQVALAIIPTDTPTTTATPTSTITPTVTPTETPPPSPTMPPTPTGGSDLIAFASNLTDARVFQIFTMRTDGTELTQVTFDDSSKSQPVFSPDGTQLLYVGDGTPNQFNKTLGLDVWLLDLASGEVTNLTRSAGDDYDPVWFPDGSYIAFTSDREFNQRNIHFMNPDGSGQVNITDGRAAEFSPDFSPDGTWMGYNASFNLGTPQFWIRDSESEWVNHRKYDLQDRLGEIQNPRWSPDGIWLVYTQILSGRNEIWISQFEEKGAKLTQLTETVGNRGASWSPDGNMIIFTSARDGNSEIYMMDLFGRVETRLTFFENSIEKDPDWQPQP